MITIQLAQKLVADNSGSIDLKGTCIFGASNSASTVATLQGLSAFLCAVPPESGVVIDTPNFLRIELRTASFSANMTSTFWFVGSPTVTSVSPTVGTGLGTTRIYLQGIGFNPSHTYVCSMNRAVMTLAVVKSTSITLISAPSARGSYSVTCVNILNSPFFSFVFSVYDQVEISSFQPVFGPPGTLVFITLSNPFESNSMICRFNQNIEQPAVPVNSTTITCIIPTLSKDSVYIEVSMDGFSFAISNSQFKVLQVGSILNKLDPSTSPISGGILVMIYGDDFQSISFERLYCSFGGYQVPAKKVSTSSISCTTPQIKDPSLARSVTVFSGSTPISSELPFVFSMGYSVSGGFIRPTIQIIGVSKVSESGFVDPVITIFGISFSSSIAATYALDGVSALSVSHPNPSKWDSNYVECTFPFSALKPGLQAVSWRLTGSEFSSSFNVLSITKPTISSFSPSVLSLNGGQYVTLFGTNIGSFATAKCTVGGSLCAFHSSASSSNFVCNPGVLKLSDSAAITFSPVTGFDIHVGNARIINATINVLNYEYSSSQFGSSIQLYGREFPDLMMSCILCDNNVIQVRRVSSALLSIPVNSASGFCAFRIMVEGLSFPSFSGSVSLPVPYMPESIEPTRAL